MMFLFLVTGNGTLEFDEFHDMMKSKSEEGETRWERTKKTQTPPDTWKAFKVSYFYLPERVVRSNILWY